MASKGSADEKRRPTSSGYVFDGDGNPTTYSGSSMVFDVENRLTSVGSTLTAGYDANNMRAWKTDGTGTTYYLYADNSTTPVCELNSSGAVVATNTYTINGLVSRNTSAGSTFYEFDPQGTVAQRLNSAGTNTVTSTADSFGVVANSGSVSDPFGYIAQAGYYTDQSTGLILTTFRYYDPGAGRFLNRDPSRYQGGVDLYGYVQNNPAQRIDPSGLDWVDSYSQCLQDNINSYLFGGILGGIGPVWPKAPLSRCLTGRVIIPRGASPVESLPPYILRWLNKLGLTSTGNSAIKTIGDLSNYLIVLFGAYAIGWEIRCAADVGLDIGQPGSW